METTSMLLSSAKLSIHSHIHVYFGWAKQQHVFSSFDVWKHSCYDHSYNTLPSLRSDCEQTQCSRAPFHSCKMLWIHSGFCGIIIVSFSSILFWFICKGILFTYFFAGLMMCVVRHHPLECKFVVRNSICILHQKKKTFSYERVFIRSFQCLIQFTHSVKFTWAKYEMSKIVITYYYYLCTSIGHMLCEESAENKM